MNLRLLLLGLLLTCFGLTGGSLAVQAQHGEHSETEKPRPTGVNVDVAPSPQRTEGTLPYVETTPAGWTRFSPAASTFSVLLPSQPEENVSRTEVSKGAQVTTHAYTVTNDGGVYLVAYMSDLPLVAERMSDTYKESFYDGMWKGMAQGIREELEKNGMMFKVEATGQRKATVGGIDGREQDFTVGPLQGRAQMALIGQRAFMTMAFWSSEKSAVERSTFFNSFQIRAR